MTSKHAAVDLREPLPETWGQKLERHVGRRNLAPTVERIHHHCGDIIGSRQTFMRLYDEPVAPIDDTKLLRAWALLTASGYDPAAFGVSDDVLPPPVEGKRRRAPGGAHAGAIGRDE